MARKEAEKNSMSQIKERDAVSTGTSNPRTLTIGPAMTVVPEKVACADWQRETEETGEQSFYWCESPLDVSLGGSENY